MLGSLAKRPWSIRTKLMFSLGVVNLIGTAVFSVCAYERNRVEILTEIDRKLCLAAHSVQALVPRLLIDEALPAPMPSARFAAYIPATTQQLEHLKDDYGFAFVYVMTLTDDGGARVIVASRTEEERSRNADPLEVNYWLPYTLDDMVRRDIAMGRQVIAEYTDVYGRFRSCFTPVRWPNGRIVFFGADQDLDELNRRLLAELAANLSIGAGFMVALMAFVWGSSRRIARELGQVVAEAEAVSRLDLAPTQGERRSTTTEIDQVFHALTAMKAGLGAFAKFVPHDVVRHVLAHGAAEIGGQRRELSLLMTDVADFTTITEQLDPEAVLTLMAEYFAAVVGAIAAAGGSIDKYVGDAVFAYWNAPALQADHAAQCCRAALAARDASRTLAAAWEAQGRWPWRTRIGVHCGDVVFGNVGAPDRVDFTVIGAAVNLASRLEGLNKFYGTEVVASGRMRELCADRFLFRTLDRVLPKGGLAPLMLHELVDEISAADDKLIAYCRRWDQAHALYRARKFNAAHLMFTALAQERPADPAARMFARRTGVYIHTPPGQDWDGIQRFDSK